jgi:hypothetical protein
VSEHTKEPWANTPEEFHRRLDEVLSKDPSIPRNFAAYTRRVFACVNACAGIPTEMLEDAKAGPIRDEHGEVVAWSIVLRSTIAKLEGK